MRRIVIGVGLLVALLTATGAAAADDAVLTITPDADLVDGQTVSYDTDIVATAYGVHPCNDADSVFACVSDRLDVFFQPSGTVAARRWITNDDEGRVVDCAWEQCWMHVDGFEFGPPEIIRVGTAATPLHFAPVDDLEIRASGSQTRLFASFFGTAPGSAAFAMRCAVAEATFVCGDVGTVDTTFDGSFDGAVAASRTFTAGGIAVDCDVHPCGVAVVVIAPGPVIAGVQGAPDPWS